VVLATVAITAVLLPGAVQGNNSAMVLLSIAALALGAVSLWTIVLLFRTFRSLDAIRDTGLALLKDSRGSFLPLETDAQLIAGIGEKLVKSMVSLENERDGLKSMLAAMSEGILVVDSRRSVLFSNPAARKILGIPDEGLLGQSLFQLTQQAELIANIEMSIVANQACSFEFDLSGASPAFTATRAPDSGIIEKRYIQAHCAPYKIEKQALFGAVAVLHDITHLRRLERMRTEFVSNVSHELRTPLTSLIGYLETLEEAGFDDKAQAQEFLAVARRQSEQLAHLVEDLLRLSKLENPQNEIADVVVSLNEVVRSSVDQCKSLASKRAIALRYEIPEEEVWIDGDRGLLVQCVGNLIENAINYNRDSGSVLVRLTPAQKQNAPLGANGSANGSEEAGNEFEWEIAVSDTGIGIPGHALNRIFERFYRVDKARSRSQGGTGLGLAIVKHIALAHGASVHVESEPGKGSTFFIRLKARKVRSERLPSQATPDS
jgi:two-component system phosphate regulon sensor histidine kinase PhoR